jgi:hypothetical protein
MLSSRKRLGANTGFSLIVGIALASILIFIFGKVQGAGGISSLMAKPDPKSSFELKLAALDTLKFKGSEENFTILEFSEISYDIQKTNSVVSPYLANFEGNVKTKFGTFSFTGTAAYQDRKWIFKNLSDLNMTEEGPETKRID